MLYEIQKEEERAKAVIVGVDTQKDDDFEYMLEEMCELVKACDMDVAGQLIQPIAIPNPATYIGSGKLKELAEFVNSMEISTVIFVDTLTPAQLKNIADEIDARVLDRTGLILEIFASRAKTREARLQVEWANLQYMLPRLVGMRSSLGRQGGASGSMSNKGQGEKQIELDRRHIEKRISELRKELELIEHDRDVQRKQRIKSAIPKISLVGYTNAGKSTLMNSLIDLSGQSDEKQVFEKDMLFATLDTTIRKISTGDNKDFLLSDTVGFISNLPHTLVKAFRSTLEEAKYADLLLIVVDSSDPHHHEQIEVTEDTLTELGAKDIPRLYVMNKADKLDVIPKFESDNERVFISAKSGLGIDRLIQSIKSHVYSDNKILELLIPYSDGGIVNEINENARVIAQSYENDGTKITADCPKWLASKLEKYSQN